MKRSASDRSADAFVASKCVSAPPTIFAASAPAPAARAVFIIIRRDGCAGVEFDTQSSSENGFSLASTGTRIVPNAERPRNARVQPAPRRGTIVGLC